MKNTTILLVEDDTDDEALTLRALTKNNIGNRVFAVRDGVDAPDFLVCTNAYADRYYPYFIQRRAGFGRSLQEWGKLLRAQTGRLHSICGIYHSEILVSDLKKA